MKLEMSAQDQAIHAMYVARATDRDLHVARLLQGAGLGVSPETIDRPAPLYLRQAVELRDAGLTIARIRW